MFFHGLCINISYKGGDLHEKIIHWYFYPTREQARQAIFEYIEVFYNRQRAQKRLDYLSPIQYLEQWQKDQLRKAA